MRSAFLILLLAAACLAGCESRRVVLPPDEAAPRVVLTAMLAALVAGDCATTEALQPPADPNGAMEGRRRRHRTIGLGSRLWTAPRTRWTTASDRG